MQDQQEWLDQKVDSAVRRMGAFTGRWCARILFIWLVYEYFEMVR